MVLVTSNNIGQSISAAAHKRKCGVRKCSIKLKIDKLVIIKEYHTTICEYHLGMCPKSKNRKCVLIEELIGDTLELQDIL